MLNKKERMEKLTNAGIETGKYFTVNLPDGLAKNSTITLTINENGEYSVVHANAINVGATENDVILNQIITDGYVRNSKLHRRFVMAQMFYMLNYRSYDGKYEGYNDCLKRNYSYKYTIDMMIEEVRVLSKLEERDTETFKEREHFFDRNTVATVLEDHITELEKYVDKLPIHKCKGVPYKKIKGTNIFVADFDKKIYAPIRSYANQIRVAKNYKEVYRILNTFKRNAVKLPWDTTKSKAWIDAYKGAGAYYTLKNMVMFHNCKIITHNFKNELWGISAVNYLNAMLKDYKGEYYRMFALLKKTITDNNFDFKKRMEEIYNK